MTTPAPTSRPGSDDLTVTVTGPAAPDGARTFDRHAREPRLWTVTTSQPVSSPPQIAVGSRGQWHDTTWAAAGVARLLLAGPDSSAADISAVPVTAGRHPTWVKVSHAGVVVVRQAGELVVV